MWLLHIGRSRREADIEIHEFDEEPQRNQRGDEVEWIGVSGGEEIVIEYDTNDIFFSFVFPPATEEEKEAGGLIVRETHFFDNG